MTCPKAGRDDRAVAEPYARQSAGVIGAEPCDGVEGAVLQDAALLAFALLGDAHGVSLGQRQRHGIIDMKTLGLVEGKRQQARRAVPSQAGDHDAPVPGLDHLKARAVLSYSLEIKYPKRRFSVMMKSWQSIRP